MFDAVRDFRVFVCPKVLLWLSSVQLIRDTKPARRMPYIFFFCMA